ncbi:MAG: hypothetical protein KC731_24920 [Myxococcales bacterium]|nr:hypothetical protein [Myxococcales bacterium]
MDRRWTVGLLAVSAAGALVLWIAFGLDAHDERPPAASEGAAEAQPPRQKAVTASESEPSNPDEARPGESDVDAEDGHHVGATDGAPAGQVALGHIIDPCRALRESRPPPDFEQVSVDGATVHWLPDEGSLIEPDVLAHLTAGLVARAAKITGTSPRAHLNVIVYPSYGSFHDRGGAPSGATGFYDGSVKLVEQRRKEIGVRLSTLRHEVMHAQLHVGAGCLPIWLHEGAAQYFAGTTWREEWIGMLRTGSVVPFEQLAASEVTDTNVDEKTLYAQSEAMVVLALAQNEARSLASIVSALAEVPADERVHLWNHLFPSLSRTEFLDWMAQWIFEVDAWTQVPGADTPLCCQGHRPFELRCYVAPPSEEEGATRWLDHSRASLGFCQAEELR